MSYFIHAGLSYHLKSRKLRFDEREAILKIFVSYKNGSKQIFNRTDKLFCHCIRSISIIATVNRTIKSNNGGNRTINLFCRFLFVGLNISDRVCVVPCKSRNGVISFYGLPIEVFDTIPESALKLLILLAFSEFVISSTFDDFFKMSSFFDTKSESFLLVHLR